PTTTTSFSFTTRGQSFSMRSSSASIAAVSTTSRLKFSFVAATESERFVSGAGWQAICPRMTSDMAANSAVVKVVFLIRIDFFVIGKPVFQDDWRTDLSSYLVHG